MLAPGSRFNSTLAPGASGCVFATARPAARKMTMVSRIGTPVRASS